MSSPSSDLIDSLSTRSKEFASYSGGEMRALCIELEKNFRDRADEWSDAGNWRLEEAKTFKLYEEGSSLSNEARVAMSTSKQVISSTLSNILSSCLKKYEYEEGGKMPELLQKEKRVQMSDGSGKFYSVYGPMPLGIPSNEFEVHTLPNKEEEPKKLSVHKDDAVTVILAAGNQPQLAVFDTLQRTLVHKEVVLIKHHPLRPHLLAPYAIIFEPLIKRGFVRQVLDEGIPETTNILSHPKIGHVHITGSLATDKAVRATLARSKPHLSQQEIDDMVTSELGACTPYILTDGVYTDLEITHAARMIAFGKKLSGGCNCLDTQVVIVPKEWAHKDQLRQAIYDELKRQPNQPTYYPGSVERAKEIVNVYKDRGENRAVVVECTKSTGLANRSCDNVTVVECGSPNDSDYENYALRKEAFGPVLAIVELPNEIDNDDYLSSIAVPFVNNKENIFGSLSCSLLAPASYDKKKLSRAVETLEYGTIAINTANLLGWLGACRGAVWQAHPSAPGRESGSGYIGNIFDIPSPAKTVVHGPSLAQAPMFDGAKPPPKLIIDALYTMDCSHTTLRGILGIMYMFSISFVKMFLSPFLPEKFIKS